MVEVRSERTERDVSLAYWDAHAFAETLLSEFEDAFRSGDIEKLRDRFYVLAAYFRRTLAILHSSLEQRRQEPAAASLKNLIVLQRALGTMRRVAPDFAQSTLALEAGVHRQVNRDLVHEILRDAPGPLSLRTIVSRFNELDLIADARPRAIRAALEALAESGHVLLTKGGYSASRTPYIDTDADRESLRILLGPLLAPRLAVAGFEGLSHVLSHHDEFREAFIRETGFSSEVATLAVAAAAALAPQATALHPGGRYKHADLSSSAHPRPYQRLLYAVLRAKRYAGQVIEAPSGSGKTLIGMLCIEDWLRTLAPGQSILVLVPTVNYQRQWVAELCLKDHGLQMAPTLVFAGTHGEMEATCRRGVVPVIFILTYAALARAAHGEDGPFAEALAARFLERHNIMHVVLDEVHKVAGDLDSSEARWVQWFSSRLEDGRLSSLVGFSATLTPFERQLNSLGLELSCVLPVAELIGRGWVAPFAEFGAPFNYSQREREIADLIAEYRGWLVLYVRRIGSDRLRAWFQEISFDERVRLAAGLGMYAGRKARGELIPARLKEWETKAEYGLNDLLIISLIQLARGWTDHDLLARAGMDDEFPSFQQALEGLRARIRRLLPGGRLADLLATPRFGDAIGRPSAQAEDSSGTKVGEARQSVAASFVGTYLLLRTWSRHVGEGRISAVRSIVAAERATRSVTGTIVFDKPAPLEFDEKLSTPTYRGVGGLFANLLGDPSLTPMAALTSAVYLPDDPERPCNEQIACWVMERLVCDEQADALFRFVFMSHRFNESDYGELHRTFQKVFGEFASRLTEPGGTTLAAFESHLLRPLRVKIREVNRGRPATSVLNSLSLGHHHLRTFATTIKAYANIASAFRSAERVEVTQGNGRRMPVRIVRVPAGLRRQLMLDLTARLVDAKEVPVNLIIVSDWARTGWNVITPNVLIDATATRNVTAWQQLRGRSLRPAQAWSSTSERLLQDLLANSRDDSDRSGQPLGSTRASFMAGAPHEEARLLADLFGKNRPTTRDVPLSREEAAIELMLQHNKVTHVYELVRAYGSGRQISYNRRTRAWERTAAIRAKHLREDGVRPRDGAFTRGASHAPLVVSSDPLVDPPEAFECSLREELDSVDERIVRGWLRVSSGPGPGTADREPTDCGTSGDGAGNRARISERPAPSGC